MNFERNKSVKGGLNLGIQHEKYKEVLNKVMLKHYSTGLPTEETMILMAKDIELEMGFPKSTITVYHLKDQHGIGIKICDEYRKKHNL